ncbi:MAG: cyclic nucleotide-binding domain-containing protein [Mariprofundaceae bacterium]|nr:cyclic nucleotide-binding domain-containing protein [Mariprofundaceae bacterium]
MQLNIDWLARELRIDPLSKAQRNALISAFSVEFIGKDMPVIHQNTAVRHLYILHSGSLRIVHKNSSRVVTLNTSSNSRSFGEISFFGDEPASANVLAETPCEVYKISCEQFQRLMREHADLTMKLMAYVLRSMGDVIRGMDNAKH